MFFRLPDEPTTPGQWQVIAGACIVLFLVAGSVGLYLSFQAPPEKVEVARQLRNYSLAFYGLALGVYVIKRLIRLFLG